MNLRDDKFHFKAGLKKYLITYSSYSIAKFETRGRNFTRGCNFLMYFIVFYDLWFTIFLFKLFEIALYVWCSVMWFELICVISCIVLSVTVCYTTVTCFISDCLVTAFWIYKMNKCIYVCVAIKYKSHNFFSLVHICFLASTAKFAIQSYSYLL